MAPILLLLFMTSISLAAPPKLKVIEDLVTSFEDVDKVVEDDIGEENSIPKTNFLEKHQKFLSWLDFFDDKPTPVVVQVDVEEENEVPIGNRGRQAQSATSTIDNDSSKIQKKVTLKTLLLCKLVKI